MLKIFEGLSLCNKAMSHPLKIGLTTQKRHQPVMALYNWRSGQLVPLEAGGLEPLIP